eukprot:750624-Hanusia_phi.AAC.2
MLVQSWQKTGGNNIYVLPAFQMQDKSVCGSGSKLRLRGFQARAFLATRWNFSPSVLLSARCGIESIREVFTCDGTGPSGERKGYCSQIHRLREMESFGDDRKCDLTLREPHEVGRVRSMRFSTGCPTSHTMSQTSGSRGMKAGGIVQMTESGLEI